MVDVIGKRVELHPATDAWVRGDRYGVIVGLGRFQKYAHLFAEPQCPYRVKLDKSGKTVRLSPQSVSFVD